MLRLLVLGLFLASTIGCGGGSSGPPRFAAHGKVTLGGEVAPSGHILFEPDTEQGNSGPGTRVEIENGEFSLPADKGHVGGPHKLRLSLFDGNAQPEKMLPYGDLLIHDHVVERDLPEESGELNLELPALEEIEQGSSK